MPKVSPDNNDILVYNLDETSGAYKNSGSYFPNDPSTDLTVSGTVIRTGTGVHGTDCPYFPGAGNYPSGASSTRNYIYGADTINPDPPITVSLWVNQRNYINNSNFQQYIKKLFREHTTTNTWATPYTAWEISNASGNSGQDLFFSVASSATTRDSFTITDFPMPLAQWNHIGFTFDGTSLIGYLNGCQVIRYSGATQLSSLTTTANNIVYNEKQYGITSTTGTYELGIDDIGNHGDEVRTLVNFPFPITVYGAKYNSGYIGSNGQIEFGKNTGGVTITLPNGTYGALLCVFQKDQDTTAPFGIYTTTTGTSPNRTFIVEWRNKQYGTSATLNYEAKFFENSDTFEFLYASSTSTTTGCIGVQSYAGGKSTVYSNAITIPAAGTRLIFTPSNTYASGALVLGATPTYLVTSSTTKEEGNFMISDVRIANIIRPLSYFQNIYKYGALPIATTDEIRYYKMRVYDLSCTEPTPVTWIDTQISIINAPVFPCGGPYSDIEILDTWLA